MKKQLATAVLLLTLSAGFASADVFTPTNRSNKPAKTWTQKVEQLVNYVRAWF